MGGAPESKNLEDTASFIAQSDSCLSVLVRLENTDLFYSFMEYFPNSRFSYVSLYLLNSSSVISLALETSTQGERER